MTQNADACLPVRCPSLENDPSTPSGLTQCADDEGHDGPHWHVNRKRSMAWENLSHNGRSGA